MAKQRLKSFGGRQFGESPYGNLSVLFFALATTATGAAINGTQSTPLVVNDKVVLGPVPAGFKLADANIHVSDAFGAGVTIKLGIEYEDGEDSAKAPQSDDFVSSALALSAVGIVRKVGGKGPVPLPKDALLVATIAGADVAEAGGLVVSLFGELTGAP